MRLSKDKYIYEVNTSINKLKSTVDYVKLGSPYSEMDWETARQNLIFHRMFKNFEEPDEVKQKTICDDSVLRVFQYDESQGYDEGRFTRLPEVVRQDIYRLREKMRSDCQAALPGFKCSITTGENVISRDGDTSVYSKLSDASAWTCSPGNVNKSVKIISKTRGLRRMLAYHYRALIWKDYVKRRSLLSIQQILDLPRSHWRVFLKRHFAYIHSKYGSDMLKYMFKKVATIIDYARITTVPKDNENARVIITCPLFDMISQRDDAGTITKILHKNYGIQLAFTQNVQRNRIYNYENATVDFANASNSTKLDTVKFLLGDTAFYKKHLSVSRVSTCKYKDNYHVLNMFSPMGCGSTFELMTWILTAAARLFDADATVFGDDVVIKKEALPRFMALSEALGYRINVTKTFVEGNFRESCGSFLSCGRPVQSFQFEWAQDYFDAVILTNKLRLVRKGIPVLEELYHSLIQKLPLLTFKVAAEDHPVLDDGVPSSGSLVRKQRKCSTVVGLYQTLLKKNEYATRSSRITQYYVREVLFKESKRLWDDPLIDDVSLPVYLSYIHNMRTNPPVVRNTAHIRSEIVLCEINNNLPITFD